MKIMIVAHGWHPETEGGAERIAYFLASELAKRHEVFALHRVNRPDKPEYEPTEEPSNGFRRFSINNTFRERPNFRWLYRNPKIDEILKTILDRERPDIIHMHHLTGLSTGLVPIAKEFGAKTIYTLHDFWTMCCRGQRLKPDLTWCEGIDEDTCAQCVAGWAVPPIPGKQRIPAGIKKITSPFRTKLAKWLGRTKQATVLDAIKDRRNELTMVLETVDALTATSNYVRDLYIKAGYRNGRILLVRDGMDPDLFRDIQWLESPQDKLRIGYLGSVIPSKGVHLLVDAYTKLPPNRASLDVYGEAVPYDGFPNYGDDLRKKVERFPEVRFHGKYSNTDVGEILGKMDVLVLPSLWPENAPLTISEAFMAKVPVVAAGWGGMQERLEKGGGLLFIPNRADSLAEILLHLIENPDQLEKLKTTIPKVPSMVEMSVVWEQIYQELISQND